MGVSGCGKSTIGKIWAKMIGATFVEGDNCHPLTNIKKMSRGLALQDVDRWPWLDAFAAELSGFEGVVVGSCSALRQVYRKRIEQAVGEPVLFIHLRGTQAVINERLAGRQDHFMPSRLLDSQLDILEPPLPQENSITVDIDDSIDGMVDQLQRNIQANYGAT